MSFNNVVIDVLDSGAVTGSGPLFDVMAAQVTTELDKAGAVSVSVPAVSARAMALVATETEIHVRTLDGIVGRGLLQTWNTTGGAQPVFTLSGPDLLGELSRLMTGYGATYDEAAVAASVIGTTATATSLLGGTGWTQGAVSIDADVTPTTITFEANTRLNALVTLSKHLGHHFRQGTTPRTLDFGVFGADSGIRILNPSPVRVGMAGNDLQGYISQIAVSNVSADLENKSFPLGKNKFDMRDATNTITDIEVQAQFGPEGFDTTSDDATSGAVIPVTATTDGARSFRVGEYIWIGDADDWTDTHEYGVIKSISAGVSITLETDLGNAYASGQDVIQRPQFYIVDAASVASYGTREACPVFSWIGSADKSEDITIQQQAAKTLYYAAQARMTRYSQPYQAYAIGQVLDLPLALRVGQKVRVKYVGQAGPGAGVYLDVDDDFYVLKITRTWDGKGTGGRRGLCSLEVANVSRPMPNNALIAVYNLDVNRWIGL